MSAAPDLIEPLVGWRVWHATEDASGTFLSSVFHRAVWPPGAPLVATCRCMRLRVWPFKRAVHDAPAVGCSCGIYAAGVTIVRAYLPDEFAGTGALPVIGEVSLWGSVHEHERGWRATFAYPKSLFVPTAGLDSERLTGLLAHLGRYGIPVHAVAGASADDLVAGATGAACTDG